MCIAPTRRPSKNIALAKSFQVKGALFAPAAQNQHHITVQHNYHDHATDICTNYAKLPAKGGVITPFPLKLHDMLDNVEQDGLQHVVSWQPHGRCFVVHNAARFTDILAKYFNVSKISSFQRQLNLYGFQRITKGRDKGGYYHELFLRGKAFLAQNIRRTKVKGTKIRARSNPEQEPDFYCMPFIVRTNRVSPSLRVVEHNDDPLDAMMHVPLEIWNAIPNEQILEEIPSSIWDEQETETAILEKESLDMDAFFEDFDFSVASNTLDNIEDDDVFGNLLEQVIA